MLINVGDHAVMRKPHACGGNEWEVTRTGADIGIKCLKCGHRLMLARDKFERAVKCLAVNQKTFTTEDTEDTEGSTE
jgi:hypothetical protein